MASRGNAAASFSGSRNTGPVPAGANRPKAPAAAQPERSVNNIIINPNQRLNPILESIKNVGKEFGDIPADFQVGRTTGVLFLSLRYHRLHPEYIHTRIENIRPSYNLRILLLMCDITEHKDSIRELTKTCILNNITVMVCWTAEEAGQYLATYKRFENKPPNMIKERVEKEPGAILRAALTSISKVNKTDVETLRTTYGSFAAIARATPAELSQLPGFGPKKVARMKDAFDRPFRNGGTDTLAQTQTQSQAQSQADSNPGTLRAPARARTPPDVRMPADKGKGKAAEASDRDFAMLDASDSPSPPATLTGAAAPPPPPPKRPREESPVWDIELDLNPSDVEEAEAELREMKRRRG